MQYIQDSEKRKYILENDKKYWIPNSLTRNALGLDINQFVQKSKIEIEKIQSGENIDDVARIRTVRSADNLHPVYAIFEFPTRHKRHIPNPITFNALGLSWDSIETIAPGDFNSIPEKEPLVSFEKWEDSLKEEFQKKLSSQIGPGKVLVRFNVFGALITKAEIPKIIDAKIDDENNIGDPIQGKARIISIFLGRPISFTKYEELERFLEVTTPELHMPLVPHQNEFTSRIVDTLASAKRMYCFAEYLSVIALCGIVGEMMAILIWKMTGLNYNNSKMSPKQEGLLLGRTFESLEQSRRIGVLQSINALSQIQLDSLNRLRTMRRPYLHKWDQDENSDIRKDAQDAYKTAFELFKDVTKVTFTNNIIGMNPLLMQLIKIEE